MTDVGAAPGSTGARGEAEVIEPSEAQRVFARRVAESKATAPHVYFHHALSTRTTLAALIHAGGRALLELPLLNGAYRDGHFELYSRVNVAFAVEGSPLLPVIHDADTKELDAIAAEIEALGERARAGALTSPDQAGATFTVIDMSPSGAHAFTPVINRGQAATLGAGTSALTLACDNRIVQGGEGGRFLELITA